MFINLRYHIENNIARNLHLHFSPITYAKIGLAQILLKEFHKSFIKNMPPL